VVFAVLVLVLLLGVVDLQKIFPTASVLKIRVY
jgi:hypothetical protein